MVDADTFFFWWTLPLMVWAATVTAWKLVALCWLAHREHQAWQAAFRRQRDLRESVEPDLEEWGLPALQPIASEQAVSPEALCAEFDAVTDIDGGGAVWFDAEGGWHVGDPYRRSEN